MKKVLINFAHPAKSRSNINRALLDKTEDLEHVTVNDLYARYPDFLIDVAHEQALCESHDIIIFQHPFYWYSSPAIVKEWFDLVLEHGWAYGSQGRALMGKYFMQAISAGGDAITYQKEGYNEYTVSELLSPFRATSKLCNLIWLPPFMVFGAHRGMGDEQVDAYAEDYRNILIALGNETLDIDTVARQEFMNTRLINEGA